MHQATSNAVASWCANRRQMLSLAAVISLLAGVTTAHAQSTGIAACDDFLTKYDACVVSKVPEAQRAMYKTQIDQTRKAWIDIAKNPSAKSTMEATCKQTLDATKASLTAYGCTFRPTPVVRGQGVAAWCHALRQTTGAGGGLALTFC